MYYIPILCIQNNLQNTTKYKNMYFLELKKIKSRYTTF